MLIRGLSQDIVVEVDSKIVLGNQQFPSVNGDACIVSLDEDGVVVVDVLHDVCHVVLSSGLEEHLGRGSKALLEDGDKFSFGDGPVATVERQRGKRSKTSEATNIAAVAGGGAVELGGKTGSPLRVPAIALGTLQLGVNYPIARMDRIDAIALVRAAYAGGVRLFDTSDAYCRNGSEMGYVEELLRDALAGKDAVIATKGGMTRHMTSEESASTWGRPISNPERIEALIRDSHRRLGGSVIRLWQIHHVDEVATVKCMAAAQRMQKEGLIEHLGVCNVSISQLDALKAAKIDIVSVQNEFNIWTKTAGNAFNGNPKGKTGVVDYCSQNGLVFIAYSPLGGLKTRRKERNLVQDFPKFGVEAQKRGVDPYVLLLAVMRCLWPSMVLLVGTRSPARAERLLDAENIKLTRDQALFLWNK